MKKTFTLLFICFLFNSNIFSQKVESVELLSSIPESLISALSAGIISASYDVDVYKVRYYTPDVNGNDHIASGIICVPKDETLAFPLTCYQHGTVAGREDVPSNLAGGYTLPVILASTGYLVCSPDYIGLGDSPGVHPYVHAATEASAGVDLMRAARELADDSNFDAFSLNDQVFVTGYSQGGHAAQALHRVLETDLSSEFQVTASAPMSGPYSISEKMIDFTLGDADYETVAYIAWSFLGYQVAYPQTVGMMTLEEVFLPEYIPSILEFKNEDIDLWQLNDTLKSTLRLNNSNRFRPRDLLQPDILNSIMSDPTHPFSLALADNDTYDWAPTAPTRMYYCQGDDQVTYENAILAEQVMQANGSSATAVRVDTDASLLNHTACVPFAAQLALGFFDSLRNIVSSTGEIINDKDVNIYLSGNALVTDIPAKRNGQNNMMTIYTQMGSRTYIGSVDAGIQNHDIDELNAGMYIITLEDENGIYRTEKIVKF